MNSLSSHTYGWTPARPLRLMTDEELKLEADACAHQLVGLILGLSRWETFVRPIFWQYVQAIARRSWDAAHERQRRELGALERGET